MGNCVEPGEQVLACSPTLKGRLSLPTLLLRSLVPGVPTRSLPGSSLSPESLWGQNVHVRLCQRFKGKFSPQRPLSEAIIPADGEGGGEGGRGGRWHLHAVGEGTQASKGQVVSPRSCQKEVVEPAFEPTKGTPVLSRLPF